jgi:hypothetical protein
LPETDVCNGLQRERYPEHRAIVYVHETISLISWKENSLESINNHFIGFFSAPFIQIRLSLSSGVLVDGDP